LHARSAALALLLALPAAARAGAHRIVGGEVAPVGMWTDTVALFHGHTYLCSGTLITPDLVLTAGHCNLGLTGAVVGAHDFTTDGERIAVDHVWEHPDSLSTYDVSVVRLAHHAAVLPRLIALDCIGHDFLEDGAPVTIAGFGATDELGGSQTTVLHQADTTLVDADCTDLTAGCNPSVSPGGELIAGGDGIDTCNGDSGGPLYLRTPDGDFLLGVTSRATNDATRLCGDGGIYVRADAVADWIEQTTGETMDRPDCSGRVNHAPVASAPFLHVPQGQSAHIPITASDPDPRDTLTFSLGTPPARGTVTVSPDGQVIYTAGWDGFGNDAFVLLITDDGSPPRSTALRVDVAVIPTVLARGDCGCDVPGGAPSGLLALLLLPWVRRRRSPGYR